MARPAVPPGRGFLAAEAPRAGVQPRRKVRVAAVGLGWVALHRHLPTMKAASDLYDTVGVIDHHPGRAESVARAGSLRRHAQCDSLDQVDWLEEVDAVTIGAPPMAHFALIRQALERGLHVLTEKPFTMTVEEGRRLCSLARERNLTLAVVHNFQFSRSMRRLLADLEQGRLGALQSIVATQLGNPRRRLPRWYEDLPFGLFYDESPHLLYLLRRLAGDDLTLRQAVSFPDPEGMATPQQIDAYFMAAAPDGRRLPVSLRANFRSPLSEWYLLVHAERCLGVVDIFRDIYLRLPNDGAHGTATVLRTSLTATWQHWWQHVPSGINHLCGRLRYGNDTVFAQFAEAVMTGTPPRYITAEDALGVLALQHEIMAATKSLDRPC